MSTGLEVPIAPEDTRISGRRYLAHVIDGVILLIVLVVLLIPTLALSGAAGAVVLLLWLGPIHVAYFVLTARGDGQTPGKKAASIRVVDADGQAPGTGALVKRTLPLLVEYFYIFAWLSMMLSPTRQRVGDRWAHTFVVKA